jgi:hypothetical protein
MEYVYVKKGFLRFQIPAVALQLEGLLTFFVWSPLFTPNDVADRNNPDIS